MDRDLPMDRPGHGPWAWEIHGIRTGADAQMGRGVLDGKYFGKIPVAQQIKLNRSFLI